MRVPCFPVTILFNSSDVVTHSFVSPVCYSHAVILGRVRVASMVLAMRGGHALEWPRQCEGVRSGAFKMTLNRKRLPPFPFLFLAPRTREYPFRFVLALYALWPKLMQRKKSMAVTNGKCTRIYVSLFFLDLRKNPNNPSLHTATLHSHAHLLNSALTVCV